MYRYLLGLTLAVQSLAVQAQTGNEKEPYITRPLNAEVIREVEARTSGGGISVTGVPPSEARIEVYVSANNNSTVTKEEIKQRLDEWYYLDIAVTGNKLTAMARTKEKIRDWKKTLNIGYKIYVPQNVSTDLGTSGGSIQLANLTGNQQFSTSGGSLHISKISGKVTGRTSGGSIHLEDARDAIDLHTSGGGIYAANCSGQIRLATSGGSLDLSNLKGTIRATTSGGNVRGNRIEGELIALTSGGDVQLRNLASSLETSTSGGNIDVAFSQMGKYVKVRNASGNIDLILPKNAGLQLDLSGRISAGPIANFEGRISDREVRGTINGGGVPVSADANTGRIKLEWQ